MKGRIVLFFVVIALSFSSCKKEEVTKNDSDFKVFSFSIDKCSVTDDGYFLLTGSNFVSKVDADGSLIWTKNNFPTDYAHSLKSGELISCIDAGNHITINKLSAQGDVIFSKSVYMSDSSELSNPKVVELSSGDLILAGTRSSDSSLLVIKTNKNGVPYWNKSIKLSINLSVINKAVEGNSNSDVILIGNSQKSSNYAVAMGFVKIDSSGTLLWEKQQNFGKWENYPTDIHNYSSDKYIVTGYYDVSQSNDYNYQFFAYTLNDLGDSINTYTNGASKQDYCLSSVFSTSTNNVTLIGMEGRGSNAKDLNLSNIKIVTINSSFSSVVSDKIYAQLQACSALSAIYNSDGSLSVIGKKYAYDNPNIVETFFMKIKPDGSL